MPRYSTRLPSAIRHALMSEVGNPHQIPDFLDAITQLRRHRIICSNNMRLLRAFYDLSSREPPASIDYRTQGHILDDIEETIVHGCRKAMLFILGVLHAYPFAHIKVIQRTETLLIRWGRLDWIQELQEARILCFTPNPDCANQHIISALTHMQPEMLEYLVRIGNRLDYSDVSRAIYVLKRLLERLGADVKAELQHYKQIMEPLLLELRDWYPKQVTDRSIAWFRDRISLAMSDSFPF